MSYEKKSFLGLKGKLISLVSAAILSLVAISLFAIYSVRKMADTISYLSDERLPISQELGNLRAATNGAPRFMWIALAQPAGSPERKKALEKAEDFKSSLGQSIAAIEKFPLVDKAKEHVENAKTILPDLVGVISEGIALLGKGTAEREAKELLVQKMPPSAVKLTEEVISLSKVVANKNKQVKEEADVFVANTNRALVIVSVVLGVVFGLFGFFFATRLAKSLSSVAKMIEDSSRQVAAASAQVSAASHQLSSASAEQASAVEETSASLEEISGMVENNVRSAESGVQMADNVKEVSKRSSESMQSLTQAMTEVMASNKKIEQLVKVIDEIGEKTEVIDEIVFQTKLLSFNASVEAERAGEHGRGFAVVAQEVGNLAQMSGKAALEISSIVKSSIKEAQEIASENRAKVEKGNEYVQETAEALSEIQKNVDSVLSGSRQILGASKEQSAGIKQINVAIENISKATQETAATSEESASAGEELNGQAQSLDKLVSDLNFIITGSQQRSETQAERHPANRPVTHSRNVVNFEKFKESKNPPDGSEDMPFKKAVGDLESHTLPSKSSSANTNDAWDKL